MPVDAFPTIPAGGLRKHSLNNLLRMGHCAPTVMQTMLDASDTEARGWSWSPRGCRAGSATPAGSAAG